MSIPCSECAGTGLESVICDTCKGKGIVTMDANLLIKIPKSVDNDMLLRVKDKGN